MEEKVRETNNQSIQKDFNLVETAAKIWKFKIIVITSVVVFSIFGIIIAIFTPNVYTASITMVPQSGEKKPSGGISGLAAMAGINIGGISSGEVLSPSIYPRILNNINFQKDLIYSKFNFENINTPITYFEYTSNDKYSKFNIVESIKKYTIKLPSIFIKLMKGKSKNQENISSINISELNRISTQEKEVIKVIMNNLLLSLNDKEGYITLSFKHEDLLLTAQFIMTAQKLLQKYITDFKIQKVKNNLEFVENNFSLAKENFENKQNELAKFRDENKNISSSLAKTKEEKLISEYNLLLSIYTELAKQKEQAKISVTETTPVFTIIEPVTIPTEKTSPRRLLIIFGFAVFGFITSVSWIIAKEYISNLLNEFNKYIK